MKPEIERQIPGAADEFFRANGDSPNLSEVAQALTVSPNELFGSGLSANDWFYRFGVELDRKRPPRGLVTYPPKIAVSKRFLP